MYYGNLTLGEHKNIFSIHIGDTDKYETPRKKLCIARLDPLLIKKKNPIINTRSSCNVIHFPSID